MGYEKAILNNEIHSKDIFYRILLKCELELDRMSQMEEKIKDLVIDNSKSSYEHLGDEKRQKMLIVAYYLSNYEHKDIFPELTQDASFEKISDILGVKKSTLKLTRDMFDAHNNNGRKGWQAELPESLQVIKDRYDKISKQNVIMKVKEILMLD